jgi:hypothetical protein
MIGLRNGGHGDESEATGLVGVVVENHTGIRDVTVLGEELLQIVIGGLKMISTLTTKNTNNTISGATLTS